MTCRSTYRGRFAPSPTGALHLGSLLTAVASYLEARVSQGQWLVRIEDLDPPREVVGAADQILKTLEAFGFEWDGEIVWQSHRHALYEAALAQLSARNLVYPCICSRKTISQTAHMGPDGWVYSGTCRQGLPSGIIGKTWRFMVPDIDTFFQDAVQGLYRQHLGREVGDFVLKRADGFWAYQLAVVVDDADQGITHIVRGSDLLVSTPRQIVLQQSLGYPQPTYAHLPILVNAYGEKLSKQTLAPALEVNQAPHLLRWVLTALGQKPDPHCESLTELWQWAFEYWNLSQVSNNKIIASI